MASTLRDNVVHWRKKLERTSDESVVLNVIHKLSKVPITLDLLQDTGIGKVVRGLAKKPGKVGSKASAVLYNWREVVACAEKKSLQKHTKVKYVKHTSSSKGKSSNETVNVENTSKKSTLSHDNHINEVRKISECDKYDSISSKDSKQIYLKKTVKNPNNNDVFNNAALLNGEDESITSKYPASEKFVSQETQSNYNSTHSKLHVTNKSEKNNCTEKKYIISKPSQKKRSIEMPIISSKDENMVIKKEITSEFSYDICGNSSQKKFPKETTFKTLNEGDLKKHKEKAHISSTAHKLNSQSHNQSSKKLNEKGKSKKLKNTVSDKNSRSGAKVTMKHMDSEAFTSSEVRFEDCLSFNDMVTVKRKKSSKISSKRKEKHSGKKSNLTTALKSEPIENSICIKETYNEDKKAIPHLLEIPLKSLPNITDVDVLSTLPQTQPNYRPLPQRSYDCYPSKKKVLSNEEAIKFTSSRREKTAVYSGRKNLFYTEMPTLFDICTQVLIEHIDSIEYMGETPYFLLKPVLQRCTAHQLHSIEDYNPYLLEDTQELWEKHCKKDFRTQRPQENETWRDLYWRAHDERERRLKSVTANISASMSKFKPVRSVKLAYVDSVVKPPRDVARRQAKNGTALPVSTTVKTGTPSKATPRPIAPAINSATISKEILISKKPKIAPLMAKTLKSMKQCYRR